MFVSSTCSCFGDISVPAAACLHKLHAFIENHALAGEREWLSHVSPASRDRWQPVPVIERLKLKAKVREACMCVARAQHSTGTGSVESLAATRFAACCERNGRAWYRPHKQGVREQLRCIPRVLQLTAAVYFKLVLAGSVVRLA